MNKMKYNKIIIAGMIFCCLGIAIFYHFRKDIFTIPKEYYVLVSDTAQFAQFGNRNILRHTVVLVSNAAYLEKNIKKQLEELYWKHVTLDTLSFYARYSVRFYRETKYLTRNFKEGNQYVPLYSHWDNTMDWRNHLEDRLGRIKYYKREDGSGDYYVTIYSSGYGFRSLVDITKNNYTSQEFNDIKDFYIKKCNELGIKKNDIENDEKY